MATKSSSSMTTRKKSKPPPPKDEDDTSEERNIFNFGLFKSSPPTERKSLVSKPESTSSSKLSTTKVSWKGTKKSKTNLSKKKEPGGGGESGKNAAGLFAAFAKSAKKLSLTTSPTSAHSKKSVDSGGGGDARSISPSERNIFASLTKPASGSSTQNGDVEPKKSNRDNSMVKKERVNSKSKAPVADKPTSTFHKTKKEIPKFEISPRTSRSKTSLSKREWSKPPSSPLKKKTLKDDFTNIFASLSVSKKDAEHVENNVDGAGDGNVPMIRKSKRHLPSGSSQNKSEYATESQSTVDLTDSFPDIGSEILDDDDDEDMMYFDDNEDFDFSSIDDEDVVEQVNHDSTQIKKSVEVNDASDSIPNTKTESRSLSTKVSDKTSNDLNASVNSRTSISSNDTIEMLHSSEETTEFVNILEEEERLPEPIVDTGGLPVLDKIVTDSEREELDQPPPLDACINDEHPTKNLNSQDITDGFGQVENKAQPKHTCVHKHIGGHKHTSTHVQASGTHKPSVHKHTCSKKQQQQQHTCSKVKTPMPPPSVEVLQAEDTSDDLEVILVKKKKKKKKRKQNKGDSALKLGDDKSKDKSKLVEKSKSSAVVEDDSDVLLVEDSSKDIEIGKPMQVQKMVESGETRNATSKKQTESVKLSTTELSKSDATGEQGASFVPPEKDKRPREDDEAKDENDSRSECSLVKSKTGVKATDSSGNNSDVQLVSLVDNEEEAKTKMSVDSQSVVNKPSKSDMEGQKKGENIRKVQEDKKGEGDEMEAMIIETEATSDKVDDCGGKRQTKDAEETTEDKRGEVEDMTKVADRGEVKESGTRMVEEVEKVEEKGEVKETEKGARSVTSDVEKVKKVADGGKVKESGSKQVVEGVQPADGGDKRTGDEEKIENEAEKMETGAPANTSKAGSADVDGDKEIRIGEQKSDDPASSTTSNKADNDGTESVQTEISTMTEDAGTKAHFFDMSFMSEDSMDVADQSQTMVSASIDSFLDNSSNFSYACTDQSSEVGSSIGNRDLERPSTSQEGVIEPEMDDYEGNPDVDDIDGITFLSFDSRDELGLHLESLSRPKEQTEKKKKKAAASSNADGAKKQRKKKKSSVMSNKPKVWVALNYHALMNELEEKQEKLLEELEIHGNWEILHPSLKDVGMCLQVSTSFMDPVGKMYNLDPVGVDLSYEHPPQVSQRDIFFPQRTKTSDYTKVKGWRDTEDTEGRKWKTLLVPKSMQNQKPGPKSKMKGKSTDFVKPLQVPHKQKTPPQASAQSKLMPRKNQPAAQVKKSPLPPPPQTKPKTVLEPSQKAIPKIKITGVKSLKGSDVVEKPMRRSSREISKPRYLEDTVDDQFIADYLRPKKKTNVTTAKSAVKEAPEREPITLILPKPKPQSPKSSRPSSPKGKPKVVPPITLSFKKPKTAAEAATYGIKHAKIVKKRKTPVLDEWDVPTVSGMKKTMPAKDFAAILGEKIIDIADDDEEKPKIPREEREESRYFLPFEKPITSKRLAFESDALDTYVKKDKVKGASQYSPFTHPLLQNQSAVVTFQMPTKQQRGIKTLRQKLEESRKVRLQALKRLQSRDSVDDDGMVKSERKFEQSENRITVKPFVPSGSSISEHIANEKNRKGQTAATNDFTSVLNKGLNERIAYLKGETYEQKLREKMEANSPLESEDSGSEDVYSRWGPTTLGNIKGACRTKATAIRNNKRGTNQSGCRTKATEIKTKSKQETDSDIEIISSDSSDIAPASTCRTKASETSRYAEVTGAKKVGKKSAMITLAQNKIRASQTKQKQGKPTKEAANNKWKTKLKIVNSKLVHRTRPMILSHSKSFMPVRDPNSPPMKGVLHQPLSTNLLRGNADAVKKDLNKSGVIIQDLDEVVIIEDESNHGYDNVEQLPDCGKDYCRLGCICDSLDKASVQNEPTGHCGKVECMFKCVCDIKATEKTQILRNCKRPSFFNSEDMLFYDTEGMMSNIQAKKKPRLLKGPGIADSGDGDNTCARTRLFNAYLPAISIKRQQPTEVKPTEPDLGSLVLKPPGSEYMLRVDPVTKEIYAVSIKNPKSPVIKLPAKLKSLRPAASSSSSENQTACIDTVVDPGQAAVLQQYFPNVISPSKMGESAVSTESGDTSDSSDAQSTATLSQQDIHVLTANVVMETILNQEVTLSGDTAKKKKKKKKKDKKKKRDKDIEVSVAVTTSVVSTTSAQTSSTATVMQENQDQTKAVTISNPGASPTSAQTSTATTMQATPSNAVLPVVFPQESQVVSTNLRPVTSTSTQLQNIATQGRRLVIGGGSWFQGNQNPVTAPAPRMPAIARPVLSGLAVQQVSGAVRQQGPILIQGPVNLHPGFPAPVKLAPATTPGTPSVPVPAIVIGGKAYKLLPTPGSPGIGNTGQVQKLVAQAQKGNAGQVQKLVAIVPSSGQPITSIAAKMPTSSTGNQSALLQSGGGSTSAPVSKAASPSSSPGSATSPALTIPIPHESSTAVTSPSGAQSTPSSIPKTSPSGVQSTSIPKTSPVTVDLTQPQDKSSSSLQNIQSGPMLIEIQSDCNWDRQKNEILAEIAKHTTAAAQQVGSQQGGRTAVRVGKYVVEIVNKQQAPDGKSQDGAKGSAKTSGKAAPPMYESKKPIELGSAVSQGITTFFPPDAQPASSKQDDDGDDDEVVLIGEQTKTDSKKSDDPEIIDVPDIDDLTKTDSSKAKKSLATSIKKSDDLEIIATVSPPPGKRKMASSESKRSGQTNVGIKLARPSSQSSEVTSPKSDNTIRLARPTKKDSKMATSAIGDVTNTETTSVQSTVAAADKATPVPIGIISAADLNTSHSNQSSAEAAKNIQLASEATSSRESMQPMPVAATAVASSAESIPAVPAAMTVTASGESMKSPVPVAVSCASSEESTPPLVTAATSTASSEESIPPVAAAVSGPTSTAGSSLKPPVPVAVSIATSSLESAQPVPTAVTTTAASEESIPSATAAGDILTPPVPVTVSVATSCEESIQPVPITVTAVMASEANIPPVPIAVTATASSENIQPTPVSLSEAAPSTPNKPIPLQLFCSSPMLPALDTEATPQKKDSRSSSGSSSSGSDSDSSSDSDVDVETCDDTDTASWVAAHQTPAEDVIEIEMPDPHLDSVVETLKQKLGVAQSQFIPIQPKGTLPLPKLTPKPVAVVNRTNPSMAGRNQGTTKRKRKSPVLGKPPCEPEFVDEAAKLINHNLLERQRRQELRDKYTALRDEVFGDGRQKAKILILNTLNPKMLLQKQRRQELTRQYNALRDEVIGPKQIPKIDILKSALEEISRLENQAEKLRKVKGQLHEINYKLSIKLASSCGMTDLKIRRPVERPVDPLQLVGPQTPQDYQELTPQKRARSIASPQVKKPVTQSKSTTKSKSMSQQRSTPQSRSRSKPKSILQPRSRSSLVPPPRSPSPIMIPSSPETPPPASPAPSSSSELDIAQYVDSSEEEDGGNEDEGRESADESEVELMSGDDDEAMDVGAGSKWRMRSQSPSDVMATKLSPGLPNCIGLASDTYHSNSQANTLPRNALGIGATTSGTSLPSTATATSASTVKHTNLPQNDTSIHDKSSISGVMNIQPPKTSSSAQNTGFHIGLPKVVSAISPVAPKALALHKKISSGPQGVNISNNRGAMTKLPNSAASAQALNDKSAQNCIIETVKDHRNFIGKFLLQSEESGMGVSGNILGTQKSPSELKETVEGDNKEFGHADENVNLKSEKRTSDDNELQSTQKQISESSEPANKSMESSMLDEQTGLIIHEEPKDDGDEEITHQKQSEHKEPQTENASEKDKHGDSGSLHASSNTNDSVDKDELSGMNDGEISGQTSQPEMQPSSSAESVQDQLRIEPMDEMCEASSNVSESQDDMDLAMSQSEASLQDNERTTMQISEPKTQISEPSTQISEPSTQISEPNTQENQSTSPTFCESIKVSSQGRSSPVSSVEMQSAEPTDQEMVDEGASSADIPMENEGASSADVPMENDEAGGLEEQQYDDVSSMDETENAIQNIPQLSRTPSPQMVSAVSSEFSKFSSMEYAKGSLEQAEEDVMSYEDVPQESTHDAEHEITRDAAEIAHNAGQPSGDQESVAAVAEILNEPEQTQSLNNSYHEASAGQSCDGDISCNVSEQSQDEFQLSQTDSESSLKPNVDNDSRSSHADPSLIESSTGSDISSADSNQNVSSERSSEGGKNLYGQKSSKVDLMSCLGVKENPDGTMRVVLQGEYDDEAVEEFFARPDVMDYLEDLASKASQKNNPVNNLL